MGAVRSITSLPARSTSHPPRSPDVRRMPGGAIYNYDTGTLNITSSIFTNCTASSNGAAIWNGGVLNTTSLTFTNCHAEAGYGGAIYIAKSGTITNITSATFTNCQTSGLFATSGAVYNGGMVSI